MSVDKSKNLDELFVLHELKAEESEKLAIDPYSYWQSVMREFFKKRSVRISLVFLLMLILGAIFVPMFHPGNLKTLDTEHRFIAPNLKYWFGTDNIGRDIFIRTFFGLRISLVVALAAAVINTSVGIVVGTIWGYFRQLDIIMIELYNFVVNIPMMLQMFVLIFVLRGLNVGSIPSLIIGMTITGWVGTARFIRNRIIVFNNREYNIASRTLGSGARRIITYNLMPQILTVVITTTSLAVPGYVGTELALAFFGIGLSGKDISLGRIITEAYGYWVDNPHVLFFPVGVLTLFTITMYLIGLALSDAIDPKTHR
jgi:oligopeptide transport system permease protein